MTINAINIIPTKTDSCPTMGDAAIRKKMTVPWAKRKKGDIVLFDFNRNGTSDHIGVIVGLNKNGSIDTIEGNTGKDNTNGGQVQKRTRYKSQVNYIVRPKYTKTITPAMLLATANSQVGIKESPKNSNKVKYNVWFYGSNRSAYWCCTFVCWLFAHLFEPVKKPTGKYSGTIPTGTLKKGSKGSKVKQLQKFLNWYHSSWKLTTDGNYGSKTANAVIIYQLTEGLNADGVYGPKTYARAKTYKAAAKPTKKPVTKPAAKPTATKKPSATKEPAKLTNAQKILAKANALAWPYGTPAKKYSYKTGAPTAKCKAAMKKYGWADNRAELSDCGNFVSTVVRESGVNKTFKALHGVKTPFPKSETGFKMVLTGKKIPSGFLKPGDIIRYKKKNGKQHAMLYYAPGKVCEASHKNIFGTIRKDTQRYNTQSKPKTIQVLRAK